MSLSIFAGETVTWSSESVGAIELGVVDASLPGVAEGISRLLVRSIRDARAEVGGHLPSWLVGDIERNYISPEKVRTLWAATGHRFAMRAGDEIIGTVHVARRHDIILTADRAHNNVPETDHPGLKPKRHHQVVNVSVRHELRHAGLAATMFDHVATSFRHLFAGDGLWVRADPPWHPWLVRLGFAHDPAYDVFLPETVERTADTPHPAFNLLHACACNGAHAAERLASMASKKIQYFSFTRSFDGPRAAARSRNALISEAPADAEEVGATLARATREGRRATMRGAGSGPTARERSDVVVETRALRRIEVSADRVTVGAGISWRELLAALPADRLPPVVPGYVDATIGGSLSTGGIGKGSAQNGLAIDHVHELRVATRDGRVLTCSRERDGWLYGAVLGSSGAFGAIVEATIPLIARKKYVVVEKKLVARGALAAALDVDAFHAFATKTADGWLAIVARESDDEAGIALGTFTAPHATGRASRQLSQTFVASDSLDSVLGERENALQPDDELTVHPIHRAGKREFAVTVRSG